MKRRVFLGGLSGIAGVYSAQAAPSDTVTVAMMGVRGRGRALAEQFAGLPDVRIACLCDVDERVFARAAKIVEEKKGAAPRMVADIRRVLDDKSIDAVVIATPDHWHGPGTILACDAGKDVYVEKPASHNLREGRLMVEAARRNRRIVQLGTQGRSRETSAQAAAIVQSGRLGKVLMAKAWNVQLRDDIGHKADSPVPAGVDYETWVGPAPALAFNENRFHYNWHWNWNYGTGDIGNDGVHQIDLARWVLGVEAPVKVSGMGKRLYFKDDQQTPDTMNLAYEYPNGKLLQFEMRIWNPYEMAGQSNGVALYGSDGMLEVGRWPKKWGVRVFDAKGKMVEELAEASGDGPHARNFIDCVKSRKAPAAEIGIGHVSSLHAHLGNIVARTGRAVAFDPQTETIAGDEEASRLLGRQYRKHWSVPRGAS
jgi:predicted dehydrogenase